MEEREKNDANRGFVTTEDDKDEMKPERDGKLEELFVKMEEYKKVNQYQ